MSLGGIDELLGCACIFSDGHLLKEEGICAEKKTASREAVIRDGPVGRVTISLT